MVINREKVAISVAKAISHEKVISHVPAKAIRPVMVTSVAKATNSIRAVTNVVRDTNNATMIITNPEKAINRGKEVFIVVRAINSVLMTITSVVTVINREKEVISVAKAISHAMVISSVPVRATSNAKAMDSHIHVPHTERSSVVPSVPATTVTISSVSTNAVSITRK